MGMGTGTANCGDDAGMGWVLGWLRGWGWGWGSVLRGWGGVGVEKVCAGWGWGRTLVPASLSSINPILLNSYYNIMTQRMTIIRKELHAHQRTTFNSIEHWYSHKKIHISIIDFNVKHRSHIVTVTRQILKKYVTILRYYKSRQFYGNAPVKKKLYPEQIFLYKNKGGV